MIKTCIMWKIEIDGNILDIWIFWKLFEWLTIVIT